jgi:hypothetical protein
MAARTKSKVSPTYKTKYRVKNWPTYDLALRNRGDITIWFDDKSIRAWNAPPRGRPWGQRRYSDLAIVTALTLRMVFDLALRQTEGFGASLISLMGLALQAHDHTTLSRRQRSVELPYLPRSHAGPLHLVVDSSGLKYMATGRAELHIAESPVIFSHLLNDNFSSSAIIFALIFGSSSVYDKSISMMLRLGLRTPSTARPGRLSMQTYIIVLGLKRYREYYSRVRAFEGKEEVGGIRRSEQASFSHR